MRPEATPSDVVRAAVSALAAGEWTGVVPLVHPAALARFKEAHLRRMIDAEASSRAPREDGATDEAGHLQQQRMAASRVEPQLRTEWGVQTSFAELENVPPADFLVRFLRASSPAAKSRIALAMAGLSPAEAAGVKYAPGAVPQQQWVVLGEVREGSRMAHVLYRELYDGDVYDPEAPHGAPVQVTTVEFVDGQWWLSLSGRGLLERQAAVAAWMQR